MRLIDADKLKQSVTNEMFKAELNSPVYFTLECVIADIDNQPNAYDVEKVVEQLESYKTCYEARAAEYDEQGDTQNMDISDSAALAYGKAIEIIKTGGVNE